MELSTELSHKTLRKNIEREKFSERNIKNWNDIEWRKKLEQNDRSASSTIDTFYESKNFRFLFVTLLTLIYQANAGFIKRLASHTILSMIFDTEKPHISRLEIDLRSHHPKYSIVSDTQTTTTTTTKISTRPTCLICFSSNVQSV